MHQDPLWIRDTVQRGSKLNLLGQLQFGDSRIRLMQTITADHTRSMKITVICWPNTEGLLITVNT
jgi:hypothetical protein